jgi:hypothetical protein
VTAISPVPSTVVSPLKPVAKTIKKTAFSFPSNTPSNVEKAATPILPVVLEAPLGCVHAYALEAWFM